MRPHWGSSGPQDKDDTVHGKKKYDVHREVCYLALMLLGAFSEQLV